MPNEMQAGVYAQLMHYFKAVRVSKDISDGASVVEQMKAIPADDPLFGTGSVRKDWRVVHPVYLVKVKKPATSSDNWALFDIVSEISATDAFRPEAEGECSFAQQ